jgi:peptidoglycan/xylan/chitin deacetylase (PgdA/CDA1 family)
MRNAFLKALDRHADRGKPARLWLRDDDAVDPGPALDQLLRMTAAAPVPVTLAVIPAFSGKAMADRLATEPHVTVAVHGWSHRNYAGPEEKKQELGAHRPAAEVFNELKRGFDQLAALHGPQFAPVLVPPWNRISPEVVAGLPGLGFEALSVFGPETPEPLKIINTHVDLIDWHGTRGGRPSAILLEELASALESGTPVGLLTHHLVHDAAAWDFLADLFKMTATHPGCRWTALPDLIRLP